jgi:transposase
MRKNIDWAPGPGVRIVGVERDGDCWVISAAGPEVGFCPGCHEPSTRRHSRYFRHLQDLPVQGVAVLVKMRVSRWRCLNRECERETVTDQLPEVVCPHARRTQRIAELVHLFGHGTGGRPAERLMKRLGMLVSDDIILRHLKRQVAHLRAKTTVRVAGIDDWSWRKGRSYGTIIIDLERREIVDVLADRTTTRTAEWLRQHPEVEFVSRDRCGLYAQGAREGAPQARQVADRFHLLQNLRETIETQLSRADRSTGRALLPESNDEDVVTISNGPSGPGEVAERRHLTCQAHRRSRQAVFDQIHTLRVAGISIGDIARQTGFGPRSIRKWLKFSTPPERRATAPKPCSPNYFLDYLSRR